MKTRLREPRRLYLKPVVPFQFRLFSAREILDCLAVPLNELCPSLGERYSAYRGSGDVVCPDCGYIVYDHPALEWLDDYGQVIGSVRIICNQERIHT
jgi:hypothetical protein